MHRHRTGRGDVPTNCPSEWSGGGGFSRAYGSCLTPPVVVQESTVCGYWLVWRRRSSSADRPSRRGRWLSGPASRRHACLGRASGERPHRTGEPGVRSHRPTARGRIQRTRAGNRTQEFFLPRPPAASGPDIALRGPILCRKVIPTRPCKTRCRNSGANDPGSGYCASDC